jgi:hypothetical protein
MTALKFVIAGGVAAAALMSAAPAAAQYYPGYGNPTVAATSSARCSTRCWAAGYRQRGYGYNNQQAIVSQCAAAVQQRLNGGK